MAEIEEKQLVQFTRSDQLIREFPEFGQIDIYGTREEPLFPASRIGELLGLERIHFERGEYKIEKDFIEAAGITKDGKIRKMKMFTERGLHKIILRSNCPFGEKFQDFVSIIIKELRLNGEVKLDDALTKLNIQTQEYEKLKQIAASQEKELKEEQKKTATATKWYIENYERYEKASKKILKLQSESKCRDRVVYKDASYHLEKMEREYCMVIWIKFEKTPKELLDDDVEEEENEYREPNNDEERWFTIHKLDGPACFNTELYIKHSLGIEGLKQKLIEMNFPQYKTGMFKGNFDQIKDITADLRY